MLSDSTEKFMREYGLQVPIVQAPTGSIAGPELAIAVANAGAIGALALTWTEPEEAAPKAAGRSIRDVTDLKYDEGKYYFVVFRVLMDDVKKDGTGRIT